MKLTRILKLLSVGAVDQKIIAETAAVLKRGGVVIIPTDTVYGVAAGLQNAKGIEMLQRIKNRPAGKPIPILAADRASIAKLNARFGAIGEKLARDFWPGPLTLVVAAGGTWEGFRIPAHPLARAIIKAAGGLLRVTSANMSGHEPARTAAEAIRQLRGKADLAVDAGPSPAGKPSTVVKIENERIIILREGAIPGETIYNSVHRPACKKTILFVCTGNICRSPMAEYMLRSRLEPGSPWIVRSAGLAAIDGLPASETAVTAMKETGLDARPHRSQGLTRELVDAAIIILVMTESQAMELKKRFPAARDRVHLLGAFRPPAHGTTGDVPDPVGGSLEVYRRTRDNIAGCLADLTEYLKNYCKKQPCPI